MKNLALTLTTGWTFRRYFGLVIGLILLFQAIWFKELFPAIISAFILVQVVTSTGCFGGSCGPGQACGIDPKNSTKTE